MDAIAKAHFYIRLAAALSDGHPAVARLVREASELIGPEPSDTRDTLLTAIDLMEMERQDSGLATRNAAPAAPPASVPNSSGQRPAFPVRLFKTFKGTRYEATLERDGTVTYKGKLFDSPSAAGIEVTGYNVNGWRFWQCSDPGTGRRTNIQAIRHFVNGN